MTKVRILTEQTAQKYFEYIFKLENSGEDMPVTFDEVWPLIYSRRSDALKVLRKKFILEEDFILISQTPQKSAMGRPKGEIKLSVSCMEYFVARRNRVVFDCYRACRKRVQDAKALAVSNSSLTNRARQQALSIFNTTLKVGKLLKVPEHLLATEAVKEAHAQTGVDFSPILQLSPVTDHIRKEEEYLEPGAMGKRFKMSAQQVNKLLDRYGYQAKTGDGWVVTDQGSTYSTRHMWNRGSKSGYNYKWSVDMFTSLLPKEEDAA